MQISLTSTMQDRSQCPHRPLGKLRPKTARSQSPPPQPSGGVALCSAWFASQAPPLNPYLLQTDLNSKQSYPRILVAASSECQYTLLQEPPCLAHPRLLPAPERNMWLLPSLHRQGNPVPEGHGTQSQPCLSHRAVSSSSLCLWPLPSSTPRKGAQGQQKTRSSFGETSEDIWCPLREHSKYIT